MEQRVIIDTDPGIDDLLALIAAQGALPVAAWTTVAGNAGIDVVTRNAVALRDLLGAPKLLGMGASSPLKLELVTAVHVHGPDGACGLRLPVSRAPSHRTEELSARAVLEAVTRSEAVTVVALGPLTNLAAAVSEAAIRSRIDRIFWMGSTLSRGNITPQAEFNAYVDPHALATILLSGVPLWIVPLDVSRQLKQTVLTVPRRGGPVADLVAVIHQLLMERRIGLHDPCVVAAAARPQLFGWQPARIVVDCNTGPSRGRVMRSDDGQQVMMATAADKTTLARFLSNALEITTRAADERRTSSPSSRGGATWRATTPRSDLG